MAPRGTAAAAGMRCENSLESGRFDVSSGRWKNYLQGIDKEGRVGHFTAASQAPSGVGRATPHNKECKRQLKPHLSDSRGRTVLNNLLAEYLPILIFLGIAVGIATAAIVGSLILAPQRPDVEKNSAYECGFEAFDDARHKFDVRFYLVAILFIIFDLEVAFLFPWAVSLGAIGQFGFWSMVVFLGILTIGFIYEWRKGALEWE